VGFFAVGSKADGQMVGDTARPVRDEVAQFPDRMSGKAG
jgi:hypothetical protein